MKKKRLVGCRAIDSRRFTTALHDGRCDKPILRAHQTRYSSNPVKFAFHFAREMEENEFYSL